MKRVVCLDTLRVENFDEIALSCTVKEIEANYSFCIFGENSKWPPFGGGGGGNEPCPNCTVVLQDPVSFVKYINDA